MTDINKPKYVGRGGWRGGGRPKGKKAKHTILASEKRAELQNEASKHLRELLQLKLMLAKGDYYEEKTTLGVKKVFKASPNNAAIDYLIEFCVGKTPDKVESKMDVPQLQELGDAVKAILTKK